MLSALSSIKSARLCIRARPAQRVGLERERDAALEIRMPAVVAKPHRPRQSRVMSASAWSSKRSSSSASANASRATRIPLLRMPRDQTEPGDGREHAGFCRRSCTTLHEAHCPFEVLLDAVSSAEVPPHLRQQRVCLGRSGEVAGLEEARASSRSCSRCWSPVTWSASAYPKSS